MERANYVNIETKKIVLKKIAKKDFLSGYSQKRRNNMIDEKKIIAKLQQRIDDFIKLHPEKHNCLSVQSIKEMIHMLELEAKEQNEE